jgi:hypothetical protein
MTAQTAGAALVGFGLGIVTTYSAYQAGGWAGGWAVLLVAIATAVVVKMGQNGQK